MIPATALKIQRGFEKPLVPAQEFRGNADNSILDAQTQGPVNCGVSIYYWNQPVARGFLIAKLLTKLATARADHTAVNDTEKTEHDFTFQLWSKIDIWRAIYLVYSEFWLNLLHSEIQLQL